MVCWFYRIMRRGSGDNLSYGIHQVFTARDGRITERPAEPVEVRVSDTDRPVQDLRRELDAMIPALALPVPDCETGREI